MRLCECSKKHPNAFRKHSNSNRSKGYLVISSPSRSTTGFLTIILEVPAENRCEISLTGGHAVSERSAASCSLTALPHASGGCHDSCNRSSVVSRQCSNTYGGDSNQTSQGLHTRLELFQKSFIDPCVYLTDHKSCRLQGVLAHMMEVRL